MNCIVIESVGVIDEDACDCDTNVASSLSNVENVRMQCVKGATCNYINSRYILETTQPWFDSLRKKRSFFNH